MSSCVQVCINIWIVHDKIICHELCWWVWTAASFNSIRRFSANWLGAPDHLDRTNWNAKVWIVLQQTLATNWKLCVDKEWVNEWKRSCEASNFQQTSLSIYHQSQTGVRINGKSRLNSTVYSNKLKSGTGRKNTEAANRLPFNFPSNWNVRLKS